MAVTVGGLDANTITLIITSAMGLAVAIGAGIHKGLTQTRKEEPDAGMRMSLGVLMENETMRNLTQSNRDLCIAVERNTAQLVELRHELRQQHNERK